MAASAYTGSGSATATIVRPSAVGNAKGFSGDTSAPTSGTIASGNVNAGVAAIPAAGFESVSVIVDHASITLKSVGVSAPGRQSAIAVDSSTMWNNATAVS